MLLTSLFAQARALCRARGRSGPGVGAARKRPGARRASFERLEMRELLSSVSPLPGVVVTSIGTATSDWAPASFLDSATGNIVVAGQSSGSTKSGQYRNLAVLRYQGNGVLDPSFGTGGVVTTQFQCLDSPRSNAQSEAQGVAAYSGGRIVAAGYASQALTYGANFALARYTSTGSLDNTFNYQQVNKKSATYGTVQTDLGGLDVIHGVVVQPDGKIVAGGVSGGLSNPAPAGFALARYTPAGQLDTSFNGTGIVKTPQLLGETASSLSDVTMQQGKILAVGYAHDPNGAYNDDFALARYNDNGTLDGTFGSGGVVITNHAGEDWAYAVAVYPSGAYQDDIVVAGSAARADNPGVSTFAVARYTPSGSLDASFGGGIVETGTFGAWYSVAIQPDGRIVACGVNNQYSGPNGISVARYNTDGSLDTSFGAGTGMVTTAIPNLAARPSSVLVQADGKIVVTGWATDAASRRYILLARYNALGNLDTTFGDPPAGKSVASPAALTDAAFADASRQHLALGAAMLQYEEQLQSKRPDDKQSRAIPAIDLALLDLAI